MFALAPTPTPIPTVTKFVTQTPTPAPTIYVKVPDDFDVLHDVWLSDFGGASLGSLITIIAVLIAAYLASRSSRLARDEERRIALGIQFLDVVSEVSRRYVLGDMKAMKEATMNFLIWRPRMQALYGRSKRYGSFFAWVAESASDLEDLMSEVVRDGVSLEERKAAANEAIPALTRLEGATIGWIQEPGSWKKKKKTKEDSVE